MYGVLPVVVEALSRVVSRARLFVSRWTSVSTRVGKVSMARATLAAVSTEQAASFAIQRRPQVESGRLPESRWKAFDVGMIGRLGLNPALARRVVTPVGEAWVVPGNGYIGLEVGGMGCSRTEVVARRGMATWTSLCSGVQDLVHGLVPDGVEQVTLLASNSALTTAFVNENVYGALLDGHFTSGRFSGPTGTVEFGLR
jgi:hypothetical protein